MIDLDNLSYEELIALNQEIVERLKLMDDMETLKCMSKLHIGTRVSFESNQGRQVGKIVKFNIKTVGVVTADGRNWKVSPHLLTEVKNAPHKNVVSIGNKAKRKRKR